MLVWGRKNSRENRRKNKRNNKFIYLLYYNLNPATTGSARINGKEREKKGQVRRAKKRKGMEAQGVKPSTRARTTDALTGEKEQNRKQKKNKHASKTNIIPPFINIKSFPCGPGK